MKNIKDTILLLIGCATMFLCIISIGYLSRSRQIISRQRYTENLNYAHELHQEDQEYIMALVNEIKHQAETLDNTDVTLANYMVSQSENKINFNTGLEIVLLCKDKFKNTNVDFRWMLAIMNRESFFIPSAYNPSDPAQGICQITPPCLEAYNKCHPNNKYTFNEMYNYRKCIDVGSWFLLDLYNSGLELPEAVSAYNQGLKNVKTRGVDGTDYYGIISNYYTIICQETEDLSHLMDLSFSLAMN